MNQVVKFLQSEAVTEDPRCKNRSVYVDVFSSGIPCQHLLAERRGHRFPKLTGSPVELFCSSI
jgi:hypothetical protein